MLLRRVAERDLIGMPLPWGWGFAYRDVTFRMVVLAPWGLNLLMGFWENRLLPFLFRGWEDRRVERAYSQGYADGVKAEGLGHAKELEAALAEGLQAGALATKNVLLRVSDTSRR